MTGVLSAIGGCVALGVILGLSLGYILKLEEPDE
jgi:hypothetical protein